MKTIVKRISAIVAILFLAAGCARDLSGDVYTSTSTLSLTLKGTVLSVRNVIIKNSDSLANNSTGMLAGGALGTVAGSSVGGGSGSAAAAVGGAIAGALLGSLAEGKLGTTKGLEYIVKVDTSNLKDISYYEGNQAMRNAISSATTSGLVTVVQSGNNIIQSGKDVYVIFSGNRTRVIPM